MNKKWLSVLGGFLTAASTSLAQAPVAHQGDPVILNPSCAVLPAESCGCDCQPAHDCGPRTYIQADYLLWWFDDARFSAPLVATVPAANLGAGPFGFGVTGATLANPASTVVFGANDVDFGPMHGMRLMGGYHLNDNLAIEAGGFWIPRQQETFSISSAGGATDAAIFLPVRAQPFPGLAGLGIDPAVAAAAGIVTAPTEGGILVASPGTAGSVAVTSQISLWGLEANGIYNLGDRNGLQIGLLAGLRHLSLEERLNIQASQSTAGFNSISFDTFDTSNRFWGGQLGARLSWVGERLSATATAKLGLGVNEAETNLFGSGLVSFPGLAQPIAAAGGTLTSTNQLGRTQHERFTIVPELGVNLTYRLTDAIGLNLGYTFLYMDQALRAGQQVDRNFTSFTPVQAGIGGNFNGPPFRQTNFDEFWAHGLNVGLSLEF